MPDSPRTPPPMIVRRVPKPDLQAMLKALRAANYPVAKTGHGYECRTAKGFLLLSAMNGSCDYLVRMRENLFTA
jgi:hypothetical protein